MSRYSTYRELGVPVRREMIDRDKGLRCKTTLGRQDTKAKRKLSILSAFK